MPGPCLSLSVWRAFRLGAGFRALWLLILLSFWAFSGTSQLFAKDLEKLKIATLPIADTILLHEANLRGFFEENGLEVDLIPFQSAMEKDAAVMAGGIDGHFCEMGSVILQRALGLPFMVVATTSHTDPDRRMFGMVTKPDAEEEDIESVRGKSIGISRLYMVDFMTDVFLEEEKLPYDYFERVDVKKIPVRYQMLIGKQLDLALFPEPFLTMAERTGGKVILDDRKLNMPLAVVALRGDISPSSVRLFQKSISQAVSFVVENPDEAKADMIKLGLIPPTLMEGYELPAFNLKNIPYALPDEALFHRYVAYFQRNRALSSTPNDSLRSAPAYQDVVFQGGR
ncbi:MAG: ABC transporter substrate-binding protein [Deltaproteobacteria bacterium]|jgi:NitT/TauT family transport system substrate-binding protein|nr:ABC transporter substrate-binding protein [Deltaproteobacteria bacterium]